VLVSAERRRSLDHFGGTCAAPKTIRFRAARVVSAKADSALERAQPFQTKWFTTTIAVTLTSVTMMPQGETLALGGAISSHNLYRSGEARRAKTLFAVAGGCQTVAVGKELPVGKRFWIRL
jgi:hypothetical protein